MSACPFCQRKVVEIDYKDAASLKQALRHDGTIGSRRSTLAKGGRLCRKHQAQFATAVKRARVMALLPPARPPKEIPWPPREKRKK